jgi:hypothetical protein
MTAAAFILLGQQACSSIDETPDMRPDSGTGQPYVDSSADQTDGGQGSLDGSDGASDAADAHSSETPCEKADREFLEFLAAHQDCTSDDDCTVVYDCGPNIDSRPVNPDVVNEAYQLMAQRCSGGGFDGRVYGAKCEAQRCVISDEVFECCGCAVPDSGLDASISDAHVDAD